MTAFLEPVTVHGKSSKLIDWELGTGVVVC